MSAKDTFTVNGTYFDGTSIELIAPQLFFFERCARELQDVSMDVSMDGVQDVYGTSANSLGSNLGRAKVSNPSMTFTVEAWNEMMTSPSFKTKGLTRVVFDYKLRLKAKIDAPEIIIECKGARFTGWGLQQWTNNSNLLLIKVPMFVRGALWNGVSLTGDL